MADPSILVTVPDRRRPGAWRRRAAASSTPSSRCRTWTAPSTGRPTARGGAPPAGADGSPPSATRPTSTVEAVRRPPRLGAAAAWRGARRSRWRTRSPRAAVPTRQRRPARARPRVRRLGHGARRRRAHGAAVGPAGRRPGGVAPVSAAPRRAPTAAAGRSTAATARPTTGRPRCCRRPSSRHVLAVYAFCRHADDIVDDLGADASPVERRRRPGRLTATASSPTSATGSSSDPVLAAVVDTVAAVGDRPRLLPALPALDGHGPDRRPLRHVGRPVRLHGRLGRRDRRDDAARSSSPLDRDRALGPARDLGVAFQLTNFLRDVDEDLDRGRVYLPQEDLARFGADPWPRRVTPQWRAVMAFEIDRARGLYDVGRPGHRPAAAPLGPVHRHRPPALLRDPRPHRGRRLRRLRPPGDGCPPPPRCGRRRAPWWAGRSQPGGGRRAPGTRTGRGRRRDGGRGRRRPTGGSGCPARAGDRGGRARTGRGRRGRRRRRRSRRRRPTAEDRGRRSGCPRTWRRR